MDRNILRAHACLPKQELEYWDGLLKIGKADFSNEKLAPFSCVFVKSVKFDDGCMADIKVCTDSFESGGIWSEMVLYDESGVEIALSEVRDRLSGTWTIEFDSSRYEVYVHLDVFGKIGIGRRDFIDVVERSLLDGISGDYVRLLAERIAEGVAEDIDECADVDNWNSCDVSLGVGRVILKALGVDV